jgi:hypothetical protein
VVRGEPAGLTARRVFPRFEYAPALANEQVQCNPAGQVLLKLKAPWRDGTTHLVMSPLEIMLRLTAHVPSPHRSM